MAEVSLNVPGGMSWVWKLLLVILVFLPTCNGCGDCGEPVIVKGCDVVKDGMTKIPTSTVTP